MAWVLNAVYCVLFAALMPWLVVQSIRKGKYRDGLGQKLLGLVPRRTGDGPCLWFHAVSVGEINLLRVVISEMNQRDAAPEIVVSTTTKSGFELAKRLYPDLLVFYCPLDFSWAVHRAIKRIRPSALVLAELEVWPNLVSLAKSAGLPVSIINGRLSDASFRGYLRIKWFIKGVLSKIDCIAAQSQEYAERFERLGARREVVHVTGSLKFDGLTQDRNNSKTTALRELAGLKPQDVVFIAGSTQEPEEQYALECFQELSQEFPKLRLILVPRHPERFSSAARLLDQSGERWTRRSTLTSTRVGETSSRILLVDTIGELAAWWGAADVAFVGGSLGKRGGQNMIEPTAYGVAVCFGPNTSNFRDVVQLLLSGDAAIVVQDQLQLKDFVRRCIEDPDFRYDLGHRAQALTTQNAGALNRTLDLLEQQLRPAIEAADEANHRGEQVSSSSPPRSHRAA